MNELLFITYLRIRVRSKVHGSEIFRFINSFLVVDLTLSFYIFSMIPDIKHWSLQSREVFLHYELDIVVEIKMGIKM